MQRKTKTHRDGKKHSSPGLLTAPSFQRTRLPALALMAALLAAGCAGWRPPPPGAPGEPEVVALVNGEPIGRDALERKIRQEIALAPPDLTPDQIERLKPRLRRPSLETLIGETLLAQAARERGIEVGEEAVDDELEVLRQYYEAYGMTLKGVVENAGIDAESLRQCVHDQLRRDKLVEQMLGLKPPTEQQMRDYYEENRRRAIEPRAVQLRELLVAFPADHAPTAEERNRLYRRAGEARDRLLAGEAFETVAAALSDRTGDRSREPVWVTEDASLPSTVIEAAFKLQPGQTSAIVSSAYGYHLLQAVDRREERRVPFEEVRDLIARDLRVRALRQGEPKLTKQLRSGAQIEVF